MEISVKVPKKNQEIDLPYDSAVSLEYIHKTFNILL